MKLCLSLQRKTIFISGCACWVCAYICLKSVCLILVLLVCFLVTYISRRCGIYTVGTEYQLNVVSKLTRSILPAAAGLHHCQSALHGLDCCHIFLTLPHRRKLMHRECTSPALTQIISLMQL